LNTAFTWRWPW